MKKIEKELDANFRVDPIQKFRDKKNRNIVKEELKPPESSFTKAIKKASKNNLVGKMNPGLGSLLENIDNLKQKAV